MRMDLLYAATVLPSNIHLVVPFPAGGGADSMARALAQGMSVELERNVVVENKSGAGGAIGAEYVARSAPDGSTWLLGTMGVLSINPALYSKLHYDPSKDFSPISLSYLTPRVLVVNAKLPVKNVLELVEMAKSKPGQLTYGSSGNGSSSHLAGVMFASLSNTNMLHVPYKGSALLLTDLLANRVDMAFDDYAVYEEHIKNGTLRILGITSKKRTPWLPNILTLAESGVENYELSNWVGILAVKGTPADLIKAFNGAWVNVSNGNSFKQHFYEVGIEPTSSTPEAFNALIKSEALKWSEIIKKSGTKID